MDGCGQLRRQRLRTNCTQKMGCCVQSLRKTAAERTNCTRQEDDCVQSLRNGACFRANYTQLLETAYNSHANKGGGV